MTNTKDKGFFLRHGTGIAAVAAVAITFGTVGSQETGPIIRGEKAAQNPIYLRQLNNDPELSMLRKEAFAIIDLSETSVIAQMNKCTSENKSIKMQPFGFNGHIFAVARCEPSIVMPEITLYLKK